MYVFTLKKCIHTLDLFHVPEKKTQKKNIAYFLAVQFECKYHCLFTAVPNWKNNTERLTSPGIMGAQSEDPETPRTITTLSN